MIRASSSITICEFLSTPSARRATSNGLLNVGGQAISIHALREEGDTPRLPRKRVQQEFLSTPSARRATIAPPPLRGVPDISIHALREEGDGILPDLKGTTSEFLSTPSARRATGYDPEAALDI